MKCHRGFSLIELMTVLSIIGILTVMSITSLKFFWRKSQSDVLSSQLMSAIQFARSEAIMRHTKTILCGSANQITCCDHWQTGYIIKTANQVIYHFQNVSQNGILHWRSFPHNKQELEFQPNGFPHSQNGTFWFCAVSAKKPDWAIVMSQSGRARIVYPDFNGDVRDGKRQDLTCQASLT